MAWLQPRLADHPWPSHSRDTSCLSERIATSRLTLAFSASVRREVVLSLDFDLFCFWCLPLQNITLASTSRQHSYLHLHGMPCNAWGPPEAGGACQLVWHVLGNTTCSVAARM